MKIKHIKIKRKKITVINWKFLVLISLYYFINIKKTKNTQIKYKI